MVAKPSIFKRIGRYIIEIIIIIIGITLSFALNKWNENQSEAKEYVGYLKHMKEDVKIDSVQMMSDIKSYTGLMDGTDLILRYEEKKREDSLMYFALAVGNLTNFIEFLPNNNTFQMLSSTGGFRVFKNKELVKEIIQLYQYDYAYIQMIERETMSDRKTHLEPYLFENIFFEDRETFPDIKTDIPKLIKDPLFRNLCYNYEGSCYSSIGSYQRALRRLKVVSKMIDEELKIHS